MKRANFKTIHWLGRDLIPDGEDYWRSADYGIAVHKVSVGSWHVRVSLLGASIVAHAKTRHAAMKQAERKLRNVKTSIEGFGEHL